MYYKLNRNLYGCGSFSFFSKSIVVMPSNFMWIHQLFVGAIHFDLIVYGYYSLFFFKSDSSFPNLPIFASFCLCVITTPSMTFIWTSFYDNRKTQSFNSNRFLLLLLLFHQIFQKEPNRHYEFLGKWLKQRPNISN